MKFAALIVATLTLSACIRTNTAEIESALKSRNKNAIYVATTTLDKYGNSKNSKIDFDSTYAAQMKTISLYCDSFNSYDDKSKCEINQLYISNSRSFSPIWAGDW